MAETATRPRSRTDTTCPTCGAPAQTGQLICLECGSRIALGYRRPPGWRVPAAIVSVAVLAVAAGLFFGIRALEDDAETEVAAQPVPRESQAGGAREGRDEPGSSARADKDKASQEAAREKAAQDKADERERADGTDRAGAGAEAPVAGADGVRAWPEGEDAFTVVILSSEDRLSARAFAQNAIKAGTPAGILRADDYPALEASTGFFIVFVGSYPNQARADRAAARLGRRFQGAYPQFVDGSKAKR